ncbi:MAG: HIT domain-containing protein [Salinisphaera sp.]|nr:HIT domain-containing protein [Salinisphaera sp.]
MEIDAQLIHDCFHLGQLENSSVLLNRNAAVGWLILVPATNAVDWHQLDDAEHERVTGQMRLLSGWAADWFHADKMNVASLGNSVRQMHIHIIARHFCPTPAGRCRFGVSWRRAAVIRMTRYARSQAPWYAISISWRSPQILTASVYRER